MKSPISLGTLFRTSGAKRIKTTKATLVALLLPFLLFAVGGQIATAPSAQAYSACAAPVSGVPAETSISDLILKPSHGKNFYVDFSKTPALNASYIGYTIRNTGADKTNVWVKLSDFNQAGANTQNRLLNLANSADYKMQIASLPANSSQTVYFLIAASRASLKADSSTTQTHTVEVFQGDPDTTSITALGGCNYSFNAVEDVLEAAANKVTSVTVDKAAPTLGELVTVTAQGTPGTVGAGDTSATGDRDIVWLSPSAVKTFPTRALRLESVAINFGTVNAGCQVSYSEQLLMTGMAACVQNVTYTATYKFRVIGSATSSVTLAPIANIASGTQIKHTDGSSATASINLANAATSSKFTIAKTTSVSDSTTVGSNVSVPYSIKVTNTGTTDLTLDYVLDDPSAGTYVDNSGSYVITNKSSAGSSVSINPSLRSDSNYYFVGPFTIPGATTNNGTDSFITINYRMLLPLAGAGLTTTYTNSASAFVGSQRVSSASSISLTVSDTGAQSVAAAPTATTNAATLVTASTATLNGAFTVGGSTISAKFAYSATSSDVTSAVYTSSSSGGLTIVSLSGTSSSDSDTSTAISGLSTGTTYYFKIMIANSSNTYAYGEVLNFQTGTPSATTNPATSVTTTSASINGTVGNGGDSGSKYYFIYGTDPDLNGATTSSETIIPGSSVTLELTGLTPSTKYYFRVVVKNGNGTITVNGEILNFTTSASTPPPAPAPVYVPRPPTITNISAPEVCAVGSQLTLTGTYLAGASATVDGVAAQVLSSSFGSMLISLPARSIGTKTIVVTNVDGNASTTVKYKFVDSPIYVNYIYPETFKDRDFSYTFTATNAEKYAIIGKMPAGLTLNPLTGEISGAPTVEGDFVFTIVASNFCDETHLIVYMFVDKAIPNTFTCSVAFNVPKSDNISDIKLSQLKNCLSKITTLSPKYIDPIIYLSGGIPDGLTTFQALTHPRYIRVIDFIKSIGLDYQIYVGAFGGTAESIQINVYWPTT